MDPQRRTRLQRPLQHQLQQRLPGPGVARHVGQRLLADAVQRQRQRLRQAQAIGQRSVWPGLRLAGGVLRQQADAVAGGSRVTRLPPTRHQGLQQGGQAGQGLGLGLGLALVQAGGPCPGCGGTASVGWRVCWRPVLQRPVGDRPQRRRPGADRPRRRRPGGVGPKRLQARQQRADVLLDVLALRIHAGQHLGGVGLAHQSARQPGRVHPQRRQALAKFIVQLTRQAAAFVLLQRQHLLAEQAAAGFGLVQRLAQLAQRAGNRLHLATGHQRQGLHRAGVPALDAADGAQQVVERRQRVLHVPAHHQQQAGDAGQQQAQRAQQVEQRLTPLALMRCQQGDGPVAAIGPGQRPDPLLRLRAGQPLPVPGQQPAQHGGVGRCGGWCQQQAAIGRLHLQQQVARRMPCAGPAQAGQAGQRLAVTRLRQAAQAGHQVGQTGGGVKLVVDVGVHAGQAQRQRQQQHHQRHHAGTLHHQARQRQRGGRWRGGGGRQAVGL